MMARALLLVAALSMTGAAQAEVIRHPIPNSTFPIAQAVEVKGPVTTFYVSGQVPPAVNKDADPQSLAAYGDTTTQTVGVLTRIKAILEGLGLTMADVVKMQVCFWCTARPRRWISAPS
jgi:enamine deaminase RidA (YjgF/YER057c/UK114 family)